MLRVSFSRREKWVPTRGRIDWQTLHSNVRKFRVKYLQYVNFTTNIVKYLTLRLSDRIHDRDALLRMERVRLLRTQKSRDSHLAFYHQIIPSVRKNTRNLKGSRFSHWHHLRSILVLPLTRSIAALNCPVKITYLRAGCDPTQERCQKPKPRRDPGLVIPVI